MWLPSGIYHRLPFQARCMTRRSIRLGLRMHALILHVRAHRQPPRLLRPRSGVLPRWIKRPLMAWRDCVGMVLGKSRVVLDDRVGVGRAVCHVAPSRSVTHDQGCPHHQTITSAYIMFNVYYPKLLELGLRRNSTPTSLEGNLWTWLSLRWADVRWRLYVVASFCVMRACLTDACIASGVFGRKVAWTTTFVGRDDPLDGFPLRGLCAPQQSVLAPRQFGGDQFERQGELKFYAFFVTFTDSRIG